MTPDPKKQSIIKAPSRAVAKARSNMASRALASVQVKTNSIGMKLKLIPAGEFLMSDNELQHRVRITKPFYMQTTTVTQSQWTAVMGTEPWASYPSQKKGSDFAVTAVSHDDAIEFCRKLSELESATYRLPTEAEWEYACRARSQTAYSFGDNADQLGQYAWFCENAWKLEECYAHRVGQRFPNSFGLYDMHGNVWEWCSDWLGDYPVRPVTDPTGPSVGYVRVLRGGGCFGADFCRSAYRHTFGAPGRLYRYGFRVAMSPSGK